MESAENVRKFNGLGIGTQISSTKLKLKLTEVEQTSCNHRGSEYNDYFP